MTKNQKLIFITLEPLAFIGPFLLISPLVELSLVRLFCLIPLVVLFIWSCFIIKKKTALAISGLIVIGVTISLFLAIALPSYWAYKERIKNQSLSQQYIK